MFLIGSYFQITIPTSSSSSPTRIRPSLAVGLSGLIPTTKQLIVPRSRLPAKLTPSPLFPLLNSTKCSSPFSSPYFLIIFSTNRKCKQQFSGHVLLRIDIAFLLGCRQVTCLRRVNNWGRFDTIYNEMKRPY